MSGRHFTLRVGPQDNPPPAGAPVWTVAPASLIAGGTWFGWGALAQIAAEEYAHDPQGNPVWMAASATAFLDMGLTWIGLDLIPGIIRSDADYWAGAWADNFYDWYGSPQAVDDLTAHKQWPIDSNYYFSSIDYRMAIIEEIFTQAAARGITVHLYFKINCKSTGTPPAGGYILADYPVRFGAIAVQCAQYIYNTYGRIVEGVDIINEPDTPPGIPWNATKIANCAAETHSQMVAAGFNPTIIAPSYASGLNSLTSTNYNTLYNAAEADGWRSKWQPAVHTYGMSTTLSGARTDRATLASRVSSQAKGWINTEFPATALGIIYDIVYGNMTGNMNYSLVYGGAGVHNQLYRLDNADGILQRTQATGGPGIHMEEWTKGYVHLMKYVKEGYQRINVSKANITDADNVELAAWKNPDNGKIVACLVSHSTGERYLNGLPAGIYKVYYQLGSESNPLALASTETYLAGAVDNTGRTWNLIGTSDSIHLTADTAGAAGTYMVVQQ